MDATREVMERALAAVGTNVKDGDLVWQAVFMVEMQVCGEGWGSGDAGEVASVLKTDVKNIFLFFSV